MAAGQATSPVSDTGRLRLAMAQAAQGMPTHRAHVERHCATVIDCKP